MAHEESGPSDVKPMFDLFTQQNEIAKQQNEIVKQVITGQQDKPALPHPIYLPLDRCLTTDETGNAQIPPLHTASNAAGHGIEIDHLTASPGLRPRVDNSKPVPPPRPSKLELDHYYRQEAISNLAKPVAVFLQVALGLSRMATLPNLNLVHSRTLLHREMELSLNYNEI